MVYYQFCDINLATLLFLNQSQTLNIRIFTVFKIELSGKMKDELKEFYVVFFLKMANPIFENNAGVTVDNLVITEAAVQPFDEVKGAFDTLVYVGEGSVLLFY